jgi:hypothetical protein
MELNEEDNAKTTCVTVTPHIHVIYIHDRYISVTFPLVGTLKEIIVRSAVFLNSHPPNCEFPLCFHFSDQSGNKAETEEDNVQQGG